MIEPDTNIHFKAEDTPELSELKDPDGEEPDGEPPGVVAGTRRARRKKKLQKWPFEWLPFGMQE